MRRSTDAPAAPRAKACPMSTPRTLTPSQGSYLTPALERATVADAMHAGIVTCPADSPLETVARTMATHHLHCVAVMGVHADGGERLVWGTITDLDVARAARRDDEQDAGTLATTPAVTIESGAPLGEAVDLMLERGVHHLVVTGSGARPVGILSALDVAGVVAWGRG
jgi:CBS domain-containing protein